VAGFFRQVVMIASAGLFATYHRAPSALMLADHRKGNVVPERGLDPRGWPILWNAVAIAVPATISEIFQKPFRT
jgi:hypothetical protein